MKSKKFKYYIILTLSVIIFSLCFFGSAKANWVQADLASQVLRFHVLANSNSETDQSLKLTVRNAVLEAVSSYIEGCRTKEEVIEALQPHLQELEKLSQDILMQESGTFFPVKASLETTFFPTKDYAGLVFPCGEYDALRIEIGKAEGHNWWCVMFPRLCFADLTYGYVPTESMNELEDALEPDSFTAITQGNGSTNSYQISVRFRFIDWIKSLF